MVTEFIGNGTTYKDKATGMWRSEVRFLDENGKKHKKVFSARTSEESAQRAQAFRNQADPNSHYEDKVSVYFMFYIQNRLRLTNGDKSYMRIIATFRNQIEPVLGEIKMKDVTSETVQKLITDLYSKGYSESTLSKVKNLISGAFRYFSDNGGQCRYKDGLVILPSKCKEDKSPVFFNHDEIVTLNNFLRENLEKLRYYPALLILMNTGMRVGELAALKWENIDYGNNILNVTSSASQASVDENGNFTHKIKNKDPKTKSGKRKILINQNTMAALNYLKERDSYLNSEYVVCTNHGKQVYQGSFNKAFHTLLEETGIEKDGRCGVHTCRHSFATELVNQKMDIEAVSYILGHSDTRTTINVYLHDKENRSLAALRNCEYLSA